MPEEINYGQLKAIVVDYKGKPSVEAFVAKLSGLNDYERGALQSEFLAQIKNTSDALPHLEAIIAIQQARGKPKRELDRIYSQLQELPEAIKRAIDASEEEIAEQRVLDRLKGLGYIE